MASRCDVSSRSFAWAMRYRGPGRVCSLALWFARKHGMQERRRRSDAGGDASRGRSHQPADTFRRLFQLAFYSFATSFATIYRIRPGSDQRRQRIQTAGGPATADASNSGITAVSVAFSWGRRSGEKDGFTENTRHSGGVGRNKNARDVPWMGSASERCRYRQSACWPG